MTPEQLHDEVGSGTLRPVYVVVGEERLLADRVVAAVREAATKGGVAGFNEDKFTAQESSIDSILSAAAMVPMMAPRRFVLVRGLDRWEKKAAEADDEDARGDKVDADALAKSPLDRLAEYAKAPVPSTVLLLSATKLHGQRRLVTVAKKGGFLVECAPLARRELPGYVTRTARDKGHRIAADAAEQLAEIAGTDLATLEDAIERLSLYVGAGKPIGEDAVAAVVTRVRQSTVWELVDALGRRRLDRALAVLADAYDARDGGLRLLGAVSWSVRQLVKLDSALRAGLSHNEAAGRAGVSPFKVGELAQTLRGMPRGTPERWMRSLAEADVALKSSRRPADAILEAMVVEMCR